MVNSGSYENSTGGEGDSVKGDFTQLENNVTSTAASPRHIVGACAREDEFTAATAEMIVSPKDTNEEDLKTESATDPNATERDKDRLKDTYTSLLNLDISKDNDISNQSETKTSLHCSVPLHKVKDVLNIYTTQSNFILENLLLKKTNDTKNTADLTDTQKSPKRLLCLFCDRTFQTFTLKQKHVDRCHSSGQSRRSSRTPGSNQSATTCNYCSKLNNTENTWTQVFEHLATEHSNRYFGCITCQERFSKKQHLQEHNKVIHNIEEIKIIEKRPEEPTIMPDEDHSSKTPSPELSKTRKKNVKNLKLSETETKSEPDESTSDTEIVKRITRSLKNAPTPTPLNKNRKKIISVKSTKNGVRNKIRTRRAAAIALKQINSELIKFRNNNKKRTQPKPTKTVKKEETKPTETESPKNEVTNSSSVFSLVNLFTYKYEKIYDHASDSIRDANSGKFDVVFDRDFYTRTVNNIQENLLLYLDGKLNRNIQSENRISNFESDTESKTTPTQETNFGSDISLNAVTPVATLLSNSQYGEDFDAQIEYASKPTQKKTKKDKTVVYKFPNRKYNSLYREKGDHSDLTCLDMWTQLMVKDKQQHENDPSSSKENTRKQIDELNSILDKRGDFDDLRSEQQAAIEENNKSRKNSLEKTTNEDVTIILNDILSDVFKTIESNEILTEEIDEKPVIPEHMNLELPNYLNLQVSPSKVNKPADESKDEWVELSGEWARPKIYICATCAQKLPNYKALDEHKNVSHPNIWCTHYEFVGKQSEFYKHLGIPGLGKVGVVEMMPATKYWQRSDARLCSKCAKQCNSLSELHRHMLECGGDWTWMLARKKLKYRPYGARTRRRRQRGYKRTINPDIPRVPREPKSKPAQVGPRQKPSDAETIERMLANLPAKRIRKVISMRDGIQGPRKPYIRKIATTTTKLQNEKPNQNVTNKNSTLRLINNRISQTNNQKLKQKIVRTLRSRNSIISEEIKHLTEDTNDKNSDTKKKTEDKIFDKKLEKKIREQKMIEQKIEKKLQNTRAINRILSSKILDTNNSIRTRRRLHKTLTQNNFIRRTRLRSRLLSMEQHKEEEPPNEELVEENTEEVIEEVKTEEAKTKKTAGKRLLSLISSKPKKKLKVEENKDDKNKEKEDPQTETEKNVDVKKKKLGLKRNKLGLKKKKSVENKSISEEVKLDDNKIEENKETSDALDDNTTVDDKTVEDNEEKKDNRRGRKVKSPINVNKNNKEDPSENKEQEELSEKKLKKSDTENKELTKKEPRDTISEIIDAVAKNTIDNDDTPLSKMILKKTSKLVENVKSLKKGFKKKASEKIANKLKEKSVASKLIRTLSLRGSKRQEKEESDKSPGRKKKKVDTELKNDQATTNETTGPKNGDIIPDHGETLLKENVCVALEKLHIDETDSGKEETTERKEESITGKEEATNKDSDEKKELNNVTKNKQKEDFGAMPTLEKFEPLPENLPQAESIPILSPVYEKSTPMLDKQIENKEKPDSAEESKNEKIEEKKLEPTNFLPEKDSENPVTVVNDKNKPSAFNSFKNKFKRTGKGLNDCIAMLKCKLEMKSDPPATDLVVINMDNHGPLVVENPKLIEKNEELKNNEVVKKDEITNKIDGNKKDESPQIETIQQEPEDLSNHKVQRQKVEIIIQQIETVEQDEILDLSKKNPVELKTEIQKQNTIETVKADDSDKNLTEDLKQTSEVSKDTTTEILNDGVDEKQKPDITTVEKRKRGRKSKSKTDNIDSVSKTEEIVQKINEIVQRNEEMNHKVDENIRMSEERSDTVQIEEPTEKTKKKRGRKPKSELEKKTTKEKTIKLKLPKVNTFENSTPDGSKSVDERVDKENIEKGDQKQKLDKTDKKQVDNRQVMDDNRQKIDERQKVEHTTVLEIPTFTRSLVPTPEPPGEKLEIIPDVQLNPITSVLDAAMKNCLLECVKSKCEELKLIPDERKVVVNETQNISSGNKENKSTNEKQLVNSYEKIKSTEENQKKITNEELAKEVVTHQNETTNGETKDVSSNIKKPGKTPKIIRKIGSIRRRKNKEIVNEQKPANDTVEPKTLNDAFIEETPLILNLGENEVKTPEKSKSDSSDDDIPLSTFVKPKFSKRPGLKIKIRKKRRNKLNASPVIRRRRKKLPTLEEKLEEHIDLDNSINNRIELIQSEVARNKNEVVDKKSEIIPENLSVNSEIEAITPENIPANSKVVNPIVLSVNSEILTGVTVENTEDLPVNLESANLFTKSDTTPIQPEFTSKMNPERNLLSPLQEPDVNEIKSIDTETESDPNKTPKRKRNKSITEISESIDSLLESSKLKSSTPNEIATVPKVILTSLPLQLMNIEDEPEICLTDKTLTESNMEPIILEATKFPGNERLETEVSQMDSGKENSVDKRKRILKKQKKITKRNKGRKKRSIIQLENGENTGSDLVTDISELNDSTLPLIKTKRKHKVTTEINREISKLGDIITKEMILSDENKSDQNIDEKLLNDHDEIKSIEETEKSEINDKSPIVERQSMAESLSLICQRVVDKSLIDDGSNKLLIRKDKLILPENIQNEIEQKRSDKKLEKHRRRNSKKSKSHSESTQDEIVMGSELDSSIKSLESQNLTSVLVEEDDSSRKRLPKLKINTKLVDKIEQSLPITPPLHEIEKSIDSDETIPDESHIDISLDDKLDSEITPQKKRRGRRPKSKINNGDVITSHENITLNEGSQNDLDSNKIKIKKVRSKRSSLENITSTPLQDIIISTPPSDNTIDDKVTSLSAVIDSITSSLDDEISGNETDKSEIVSKIKHKGRLSKKLSDSDTSVDDVTKIFDELSGSENEIIPQSKRKGRIINQVSDSEKELAIENVLNENDTDKTVSDNLKSEIISNSEILTSDKIETPKSNRRGRARKSESNIENTSKLFDEISGSETDKSEILSSPIRPQPKRRSRIVKKLSESDKETSADDLTKTFDEISGSETDKSEVLTPPLNIIKPQSKRRRRVVKKLSESDLDTSIDDLSKVLDFDETSESENQNSEIPKPEDFIPTPDDLPTKPEIPPPEADTSNIPTPTEIPNSDSLLPDSFQIKRKARGVKKSGMRHKKLSENDSQNSESDIQKASEDDETDTSDINTSKDDIDFIIPQPEHIPKNIRRKLSKDQKKLMLNSLLFQKESELQSDELSSPEVNENEFSLHKPVSKRGRKKKNPEISTDKQKTRKRRSKTDSESSTDGALISDINKEINEVIKIVTDNSVDVNLSDKIGDESDSLIQSDLLKNSDDLSETDSKIESIEEFSNIAEKILDVLDQDKFVSPKGKQRRRRSKKDILDDSLDENKSSDDFEFAPPQENVKKSKSRKRRSKGLDDFDTEEKTDKQNDDIKNSTDIDNITNSDNSNSEMISNMLDPILPDSVPNIFDEIPKTPNITMGSDESEDEIPLSFIAKTIGQNIDEDVLNDLADNPINDIVLNEDESLGTVERNLEKAAKILEDKNLIDDLDKIDESALDISYDIVNSRNETMKDDLQNSKDLSSDFITSPDMNNKSLVIKIQKKFNVKMRKTNKKPRKRIVKPKVENVKKPEIEIDQSEIFCDICNRTFRRAENLIKHKRTLTHISKLSEIEARENAARQNALREEEMRNKEKEENEKKEEVSKIEEEVSEDSDKEDNQEVDQGSDLDENRDEDKESDQEDDLKDEVDEDEESDEDQLRIDVNKKCDVEEDETKQDKKELEDIEQNVDTIDLLVPEKVRRNFQNIATKNSNLKLADIINNVLDKPVNDLNMSESELLSKNISNSIQMAKKQPKRYKSLGERKSFDSDNSYTLIPQQSPSENDFTTKQTTNQLLNTQLTLLENIIEKNSPEITNYIDDSMSYSSNQFDENTTSKKDLYNYPIKFNEPQIKFSHNNDIISSFIKPDGHFTHFEKQSKPNNFDEQTQQFQDSSSTKETTRKILNRDEELFLECCSLLKSGSEISSVSKKSTKQIPLNNFSDKNWTDQKQNYIPRESYSWLAQNSRVETPIGEPYVNNDWSNSNSAVSSEWLVKTSSPDHPVENNTSKKNINGTEGKYQTIHFEDISLDSSTTRNTEISPAVSKHVPENIPLDFHHVNFEKSNLKDYTEDDNHDKKDESVVFEEINEEKEKKNDVPIDEVDEDLKRHVVTAFGGLMAKALKSRLKAVVRRSNKAKEKRTLISALQPAITNYGFPIKKPSLDIDLSGENNSSDNPKKMVTKGAMKVFEGIKVSIPTQDLNLPEVLKLKSPEGIKEPEKPEEPKQQKIEKLILSKKKINKKKQMFKRFGNKLGLKETKKNNKRMKIDKNKPHDVYDFDDSQENSVLKTNLSDFRNYRKDTTDKPDSKLIDESESETDRYYDSISFEENSISSESVEQNKFKNTADKSLNKDNQNKCVIMGRIFKNASKPKLEDKIPEIRDISSEENSKLVETYLESFDSFDNVTSTVEPLNHGLTIINSANKMSKHEMDQLFDKLLEDNTKFSAETKEIILKEKVEKKEEVVKPKVQRVNKKRQRHHSEDSTSTDEFTLHGRQTKSKKHKKHPRKPNNRRKNNGGINLEQEIKECIGVAGRKSQRKCTSGKQNVLAEFWSSDESEIDYAAYCPPVAEKPEEKIDEEVKEDETEAVDEIIDDTKEEKEEKDPEAKDMYEFEPEFDELNEELPKLEHKHIDKPEHQQKLDDKQKHKHKKVIKNRRHSKTKDDSEFEAHRNKRKMEHKRKHNSLSESSNADTLVGSRRKRNAAETLYYWSSTSEDDDVQDLIEVKPIREDTEDDRPMQHGWIVGDSPKKLVTMLAQAKVLKKNDCESVKEQGKKNRVTL